MKLNQALLLILCVTPLTTVAATDAQLRSQLQQCRQLQQDQQRLACFDQIQLQPVTAPVSLPPPASQMPVTAASVAPAPQVAANPEAAFGAEKLNNVGPEKAEKISSAITAVESNALKKLTLTLENGQQWRQIDTDYIRINVGDTATIRRAAFGSFLLGTDKVNKTIRVRRVK
ncbi:hypothetical protein [Rheinheimera sp. 4Y26]|uniref:hypothetical protein n=1 Tax=Rheinheimera sp. 4Y26 TaxID=2977811 RepID=UPI0021B0DAB0|nr:hypothetical protein [Rheinheimera sp. 4Y26]MCT6701012.1 hypothetical protein [Rheinheimera sp. 4Y26]